MWLITKKWTCPNVAVSLPHIFPCSFFRKTIYEIVANHFLLPAIRSKVLPSIWVAICNKIIHHDTKRAAMMCQKFKDGTLYWFPRAAASTQFLLWSRRRRARDVLGQCRRPPRGAPLFVCVPTLQGSLGSAVWTLKLYLNTVITKNCEIHEKFYQPSSWSDNFRLIPNLQSSFTWALSIEWLEMFFESLSTNWSFLWLKKISVKVWLTVYHKTFFVCPISHVSKSKIILEHNNNNRLF